MINICVIGDSQLNAIKGGWDLLEDEYPDLELTFFGAARKNMGTLEVGSGCLLSPDPHCTKRMRRSSNGLETIADDYDAYLLVGLEFGLHAAVYLCMTHRIECDEPDDRIPISDACLERVVEDELRQTISISTVEKLHQITDAPIAVLPYPLRCRSDAISIFKRIRETGTDKKVRELADGVANRLSEEYRFRLFLQPEETLSSPLGTNSIYSRIKGSNDGHMNSEYGKEVLKVLFSQFPS
ncbi:MAG TPA: hypothetical protein VGK90_03810 [Rhizomicrobium sp.]